MLPTPPPKLPWHAHGAQVDPPEGLLDLVSTRKLRRPYTPEQAARLLAQLKEDEAAAKAQQAAASGGGAGGDAGAAAQGA
jgi:hypothetical protein